jgi:hypothetical protein
VTYVMGMRNFWTAAIVVDSMISFGRDRHISPLKSGILVPGVIYGAQRSRRARFCGNC